jgi:hypothetical protein
MGRRGSAREFDVRVCNNLKSNTLRLATFTRWRQSDPVLFGCACGSVEFRGLPLRGAAVCIRECDGECPAWLGAQPMARRFTSKNRACSWGRGVLLAT